MSNVKILGGETLHDLPVSRVLDGARDLEYVLVLGWTDKGEFIAGCSEADLAKATFAAQRFITEVHTGVYGDASPRPRP